MYGKSGRYVRHSRKRYDADPYWKSAGSPGYIYFSLLGSFLERSVLPRNWIGYIIAYVAYPSFGSWRQQAPDWTGSSNARNGLSLQTRLSERTRGWTRLGRSPGTDSRHAVGYHPIRLTRYLSEGKAPRIEFAIGGSPYVTEIPSESPPNAS